MLVFVECHITTTCCRVRCEVFAAEYCGGAFNKMSRCHSNVLFSYGTRFSHSWWILYAVYNFWVALETCVAQPECFFAYLSLTYWVFGMMPAKLVAFVQSVLLAWLYRRLCFDCHVKSMLSASGRAVRHAEMRALVIGCTCIFMLIKPEEWRERHHSESGMQTLELRFSAQSISCTPEPELMHFSSPIRVWAACFADTLTWRFTNELWSLSQYAWVNAVQC